MGVTRGHGDVTRGLKEVTRGPWEVRKGFREVTRGLREITRPQSVQLGLKRSHGAIWGLMRLLGALER